MANPRSVVVKHKKRQQAIEAKNRTRIREARIMDTGDAFEGMEAIFLGTSGNVPTTHRNTSSMALRLENGETYLFDCGEGCQVQILKSSRLCISSVSKIFISHLHGDHVYGLPGLLSMIQTAQRDQGRNAPRPKPVQIYGPAGLYEVLSVLKFTATLRRAPEYTLFELVDPSNKNSRENHRRVPKSQRIFMNEEDGVYDVHEDKNFIVKAVQLPHKPDMKTFAYVVQEKSVTGRLDAGKLMKEGIEPGPIYKKIKSGETVTLPNGKKLDPKDYVGPRKPGRKVAIIYDNCDSEPVVDLAYGADLMVHEALLETALEENARLKGHSSARMAGVTARKADVKSLALTHFSNRYYFLHSQPGIVGVDQVVNDAKEAFGSDNVIGAEDFMSIPITRP